MPIHLPPSGITSVGKHIVKFFYKNTNLPVAEAYMEHFIKKYIQNQFFINLVALFFAKESYKQR